MSDNAAPEATLYRMDLPGGACPSGLKSRALLEAEGYTVHDQPLTSREAVDAFLAEHDVPTTPQTFIAGDRIGGFEALSAHLGVAVDAAPGRSYRPVIALFAVAAALAVCVTWLRLDTVFTGQTIAWFIALAMVLLGLQKLQDIDSFARVFAGYDLLAQRWPGYAHVYPYIETGAGLLMLAGVLTVVSAPLALVAAGIGAISVFKAVYLDKRDLVCACVGGDRNVPLGFVSLLENLMMVGMAIWMLGGI